MKRFTVVILFIALSCVASAKTCDSVRFSNSGGWKPVASAPHDGTVVEMMETFGIAPWYGIYKWTKEATSTDEKGARIPIKLNSPTWISIDRPGTSVDEDECLFWRPYTNAGKYVDPTGGAQDTVEYWCRYLHLPYDKKKDVCVTK